MSAIEGADHRSYRSRTALLWMVLATTVVVFGLGDALVRGGVAITLQLAPWVLLVLWLIWVLLYATHVRTDTHGIRVHNVLRIVDIPWARVTDITMRWQLEVHLDSGETVRAFGGPAPKGVRAGRRGADSAAQTDLAEISALWDAQRGDAPRAAVVTRRWDLIAILTGVGLVIWAAISVLSVA